MKISPRLPDESVNLPKRSRLRECIQLVVGTTGVLVGIYFLLGICVDLIVPYAPHSFEQFLGNQFLALFPKESRYEDNEKQLNTLLKKIIAQNPSYPSTLSVRIVTQSTENALAVPGDTIIVFSQLLKNAHSENEIAMVLAHEVGHFYHRDQLRSLGRSLLLSLGSFFLLGQDNDMSKIVIKGIQAENLHSSRSQELAADTIAVDALYHLYGHVNGIYTFLERQARQEHPTWLDRIFLSHPPSIERSERLREIILEKKYSDKGELVRWEFA